MRMYSHVLACLALLVAGVVAQHAHAQSLPADWLDGTTEARIKAVYEQGQFRPKSFSAAWWPDSSGFSIRQRARRSEETIHYDVSSGKQTAAKPPEEVKPGGRLDSPDGKRRLEIRHGNLFVIDLRNGERIQLTEMDPNPDIRIRSPKWSPDGKYVAFTESDDRHVKKRAMLVPKDPSYPGIREQRFARVGEAITSLRIGVVNIEEKSLHWLPLDSPKKGFYLGLVEWSKSPAMKNQILVEWLSRSRDQRKFFLAPVEGEPITIFQESNPAWVVASQGKNSGLDWIQGGESFVVISEKDGWRHAYRYSRQGKELALLTSGEYDIIERAVIDEQAGWYYFYASPENATEKYLYRVPLDGSGSLERITPADQPGTHEYQFSPDAKWAFHTFSSFDKPPVTELVEIDEHRVVRVLEDNKRLQDRVGNLISRPTDFLQLDIGGGIELDAWLIKPRRFDETKKYPVFIYVYGEPHSQTVLNQWGAGQSHYLRAIADLGYLVVSIDNRGTPAPKGAAWRRSIFGSLGPLSTEEQALALKELGRTLPFVDLERVGIWGWSGGGSNTLNALFRKPNDYHVGIAVVPKPQPHLYNAWFQEIYMRTRETNPDGYKKSAPIHFADGLKGKLLIITGSGETNTHIQIIEGLVDRLVELGKQFDYMVYPNRDHGLREGRGSTVHVRMLIARYLLENLVAGPK